MKNLFFATLVLVVTAFQSETKGQTKNSKQNKMEQTTEKSAIENLLSAYREALLTSDVNQVLPLFTNDGVFMPSSTPTAVGQAQVKASYENVFKTIQLKDIQFFTDEIVVNGDYAFLRTTSKFNTLIHANGQTVAEEDRALFVLQKINGEWKISRYIFNKMK